MMEIPLLVQILDIDSRGIATVLDPWGGHREVPINILRAKGDLPQVGETWIIDKAIGGSWTFAAIVQGNLSTGSAGRLELHAGTESEPPSGYLWCDGAVIEIAQYPELYASIGSKYDADTGMKVISTGSLVNHATDTTPTVTMSANSATGDLTILVIAIPSFFGSGVVQSVSGLGGTWEAIYASEVNDAWGMRFEVWSSAAIGVATDITVTLSAKAEVVIEAVSIRGADSIADSQWITSVDRSYASGLGEFPLRASTPADLMVVATARPDGTSVSMIEVAPDTSPFTTEIAELGGTDDHPLLMGMKSKITAYEGAIPIRYTVESDALPWAIGGVMVTPAIGQAPTFALPNIPNDTLGGQSARWMISTGRTVSLFAGA